MISRLMKAQQRIGEAIRWRLWDVRFVPGGQTCQNPNGPVVLG